MPSSSGFQFLPLAPTTSASYPQAPAKLTSANVENVPAAPGPLLRRTSSMSTSDSTQARRFLKLGPVHFGEHQDEHKGDWHAVE